MVRKEIIGLVIVLLVIGISLEVTTGRAIPSRKFLIYDGQIVYEEEDINQEYIAEYDIEWEMRQKVTITVTVTNVGPDTVRFSKEITFKIASAYQKVEGIRYGPESYSFRITDAEENVLTWNENVLTWFNPLWFPLP